MKFTRLRNAKKTLKTQRELEDKNQLLSYIYSYLQSRAFSMNLKIEKLKAPLFPSPDGAGNINDWCITHFTNTKPCKIYLGVTVFNSEVHCAIKPHKQNVSPKTMSI